MGRNPETRRKIRLGKGLSEILGGGAFNLGTQSLHPIHQAAVNSSVRGRRGGVGRGIPFRAGENENLTMAWTARYAEKKGKAA